MMEMENVVYRKLRLEECTPQLFVGFDRYQEVTHCWRKEDGNWVLKEISFLEEWTQDNFLQLSIQFQKIFQSGGTIFAAFLNHRMIAFACLEREFLGSRKQYLQLSELYTSRESRGKGIGTQLFHLICVLAKQMGAEKLYISAHSSRETQAFYRAQGCVEAEEYDSVLTEKEPCDCQMECNLRDF